MNSSERGLTGSRLAVEDDLVAVDLLHEERVNGPPLGDSLRLVEVEGEVRGARLLGRRGLLQEATDAEVILKLCAPRDDEQIDVRLGARALASRARAVEPDRLEVRAELVAQE